MICPVLLYDLDLKFGRSRATTRKVLVRLGLHPMGFFADTTRKSGDFIGCAGEKTLAKPSKFSPSDTTLLLHDTTFVLHDTTFVLHDTTLKNSGDLIGRNRVVFTPISTALSCRPERSVGHVASARRPPSASSRALSFRFERSPWTSSILQDPLQVARRALR